MLNRACDDADDDPYRCRAHEAEQQRAGQDTEHRRRHENSQFRPYPPAAVGPQAHEVHQAQYRQQDGGCLQRRNDECHQRHRKYAQAPAKAAFRDTEKQHGRHGSHVKPWVSDQGLLLPGGLTGPFDSCFNRVRGTILNNSETQNP